MRATRNLMSLFVLGMLAGLAQAHDDPEHEADEHEVAEIEETARSSDRFDDDGFDFRIGPRGGPGEIRIDSGERIGDEIVEPAVSEDTFGLGVTFEYKTPFWIVAEAGLFSAGSTDWFDSEEYQLFEYFGSIGVEIPLGNGFTLTPRVGRARWKLESDEVWFFDEDEDPPTIRGYQNYWEITAAKRITQRVSLGVSHRENHYDFGRVRSTVFTAMFSL